ncbi:asparagine synthase (glutamine-hydrolyzing) [Streptomyces sp. NPDC039016]|uniref:asparagine synthase (glutamine-hydrolyzing) n=1 Tax=unclassified Streptomyces TaxID=2593676 RepID=UPI000C280B33|nr:asparagine synthase (glutamine-hydrolyzing) [Streptomyces sp. CB02959]PJN35792.1 asparagine synthase (glutamine-hydrolyzing) [Streptomyces sp. CB02959]
MCGLAGFLSTSLRSGAAAEVMTSMLSTIRHRGPDEAGYYLDDGLAMGAVRLAIVDLADGAQPMSDPSRRYWICFNGELYNHIELRAELEALGRPFRTDHSDTEVVLQAWIQWGTDCFTRFNGAFAVVIRDAVSGDVVLARDRYGKRPLFHTDHDGAFLFASEMKAFGAFPGFRFALDPRELANIYATWTPLPDRTPYQGIRQLPPGSVLTLSAGRRSLRSYEDLSFDVPGFDGTEAEALDLVRDTLRTSVAMRLRSDVEVGVYLSGGLDSSVVTRLATQLSPHQVRTFSVAFSDKSFDESASQRLVADHLGTRHSTVPITGTDISDNFLAAVYHAEVPTFRTSFVPMFLLSRHVRDAGIKTVLSGEGADEAFLGYSLFRETLLRERWDALDDGERRAGLATLHPELAHFGPAHQAHLLGLYQQFSKERLPGLFSHEMRYQNGLFAARLLTDGREPFGDLLDLVARTPGYANMPAVHKAQWLEYKTLLAGFLLSTQGERVALAHSVENRCPFLDPAVVRAAASVNLRYDDGRVEKALLKKAFRAELPEWTTRRPKQPYLAPGSTVFKDHRPDYLELVRSDHELSQLGYVDRRFARRLVDKVMSTPAEEISTKEDQAFLYLLTTAVLHQQFVRGDQSRKGPPSPAGLNLRVTVDNRRAVRRAKETR